ncbi:MAG TPA: hypothetical protein VNT79_05270 [Phycisphaerae bacterium]|nr:hypothetical protein [Phycisphaerae bacterium]
MRFELLSAFALGSLLPMLETARRGFDHWTVSLTTMFEDYVAGALLLVAGIASIRAKPFAPQLLLVAWAYVTGMMSSSFWSQLESTIKGVDLEPNNSLVLLIKLLLWGTCVVSLVLSFRRSVSTNGARHTGDGAGRRD